MQRRGIGVFAALALAGTLAACKNLPSGSRNELFPPALPAGAARLSDPEIQRARDLYVAKCAKCHRFYNPAAYPEAEWTAWMKKMSRKAKLEREEEQLLIRYLGAFRAPEAAVTNSGIP